MVRKFLRFKWQREYEVNCTLRPEERKIQENKKLEDVKYKDNWTMTVNEKDILETEANPKHLERYMDKSKKRIAVIGAGVSGMSSIAMLKEEGLEPVCFEKTDRPGGTWFYREETIEGVASIMPTTIINHSKEMGAFSTFPPAKEYNNYMRHYEMYQYLMEYWSKYDCLKHVRVNMEVISVKRTDDYNETGRWAVTAKSLITNEISTEVYDGVVVCVGHINRPKMAIFPGQDKFKGKIIHSHSLKGVDEYKNQVIVIVGTGCSALDAAVETSNVAKQVYVSSKTGAHIMTRIGPHGKPMDYVLLRRYLTNYLNLWPRDWCSKFLEKKFLDSKFDHKLYKVHPKHRMLSKDPIINDHIGSKLLSGSVVQKGDISHFTETGVVFNGEDEETRADTVIMATGYTWKFPFLDDDIVIQEEGRFKLYKCMYPPHLPHPTLVLVGFVLVWGPGMPVGEMQARWAASIFSGRNSLPSVEEMEKDIQKRHSRNAKWYAPNDKMTIRVDFVQYLDEIATLLGAKPNFCKLFFTDPKLFWKLIWGPSLSYQYRLQGPHKWKGARETILTSKERLMFPLKFHQCQKRGVEKEKGLVKAF
ncbi:flavin-containing monooxygenase 5-like [Argiope bruennichi]|uniref:flavin-containing monooxygenase 5-like n=1 Tax=Argiope bruennichi TaxID=94029 RepID=UPI00249448DB|nr:flavin-containing monooxygenase 5-like [Argiope bruennichi]